MAWWLRSGEASQRTPNFNNLLLMGGEQDAASRHTAPLSSSVPGTGSRQPLNSCLWMKCLGVCPDLRAQPWNTVLQGHLSGIPWSRRRKYHQTTPPAFPATNDLKPKAQSFEAGISALEGKRGLLGEENSFLPHGYELSREKWKIGFLFLFVWGFLVNKKKISWISTEPG